MSWTDHDGNGHGRKYIHVTETPDVSHITNPDVMHEESDVSVRGVGAFVGMLFGGLILMGALMVGLFKFFEWRAEVADRSIAVSPMARTAEERLPPPPRLQAAPGFRSLDDKSLSFEKREPSAEWDALREKWMRELETPGALDPGTQTMHVPIEDAKQMLLKQNPPARAQQPGEVTSAGMDVPSYSSAGRQMEKRDQ
jgi:hypothetical protein